LELHIKPSPTAFLNISLIDASDSPTNLLRISLGATEMNAERASPAMARANFVCATMDVLVNYLLVRNLG
jgi:hypothetical protein